MMTQQMRINAALMAAVYPTLLLIVWIMFDFLRDLEVSAPWWFYAFAWVVLFVRDFYRERRKALRKVERVK